MITRKLVKIHKIKKGRLNEKRELNEELQSKGYLVVAGKVPKVFWKTKFYGYIQTNQTA